MHTCEGTRDIDGVDRATRPPDGRGKIVDAFSIGERPPEVGRPVETEEQQSNWMRANQRSGIVTLRSAPYAPPYFA
jgi:hypothetical protein